MVHEKHYTLIKYCIFCHLLYEPPTVPLFLTAVLLPFVTDPYLAYDAPIDGRNCIRDGKVEQALAYGFVEVGHSLNQVLDQVKNKIYDRHLDVVYDAESSVYLAIGG